MVQRVCTSPTGFLHIELRTALYAYVGKKRRRSIYSESKILIKKREVGGATDALKTPKIFGLNWDEYYYNQKD